MLFCSSFSGWSPPPRRPGSELVSVRAALAAACRTRASRGGAENGQGGGRVPSQMDRLESGEGEDDGQEHCGGDELACGQDER